MAKCEHRKRESRVKQGHNQEIIISLIILVIAIIANFNIFLSTRDVNAKVNRRASTAEWVRSTYQDRETYYLRNNPIYLSIHCKRGKIVTTSLETLSTISVHALEGGIVRNSRLSNIVIDGKLWYVPVIKDGNNPSKEQVELLNRLGDANVISFDHGNNRYVWAIKNATTFKYCLNREDVK